jgi:hypothetical protein
MSLVGSKTYKEGFEIIKQPTQKMDGYTAIKVTVPKLVKTSALKGKSGLRYARPGWDLSTFVKIKNTGNIVWYDKASALPGVEPLVLNTANPFNRPSKFGSKYEHDKRRITSFLDKVYSDDDSTLATNQHTVRPGETGVFRFTMHVPSGMDPGLYTEWVGIQFAGSPEVDIGKDIPIEIKVLKNL